MLTLETVGENVAKDDGLAIKLVARREDERQNPPPAIALFPRGAVVQHEKMGCRERAAASK